MHLNSYFQETKIDAIVLENTISNVLYNYSPFFFTPFGIAPIVVWLMKKKFFVHDSQKCAKHIYPNFKTIAIQQNTMTPQK